MTTQKPEQEATETKPKKPRPRKDTNPDIGTIKCPMCSGKAFIRQFKTGRKLLYVYCPIEGKIAPEKESFQEFVLTEGSFFSPAQSEPPKSEPPTPQKTETTTAPTDKPKSNGGSGWTTIIGRSMMNKSKKP